VGNIRSTGSGILVEGDATIDVQGSISSDGNGILGGEGGQLLLIDTVVTGGSAAIHTAGGNDAVFLSGNSRIEGDIRMGEGDDTVQISSGARVNGIIYGGEGDETEGDLLIVGDATYCRDQHDSFADYMNQRALIASINPDDATFTSEGETYTIREFERLESGLRLQRCHHFIDDGRINAYDLGASVAGYCNVEEGVNLWAIAADGSGQADVSVSGAQMRAALEAAVSSGQHQLIAEGALGSSLWALASNEYQLMGPDINEPGKMYSFIFAPDRCGEGAAL